MTMKQILLAKGITLGTAKDLSRKPDVKLTFIKAKGGLVWMGVQGGAK